MPSGLPGRRPDVPPTVAAMGDFLTGEVALNDGNYDVALSAFRSAVEHDPASALLRLRLATLLGAPRRAHRGARALPRGRRTPSRTTSRRACCSPASCRRSIGRTRRRRSIAACSQIEPAQSGSIPLSRRALREAGQVRRGARRRSASSIHLNPRSVLGYYYLGRVNTAAGQFAEGRAQLPRGAEAQSTFRADPDGSGDALRDAEAVRARDRDLPAHPRAPTRTARSSASVSAVSTSVRRSSTRRCSSTTRSRRSRPTRKRPASRSRSSTSRRASTTGPRRSSTSCSRAEPEQRAGAVLSRDRVRADEGVREGDRASSSASAPNPSTTSTRVFRPRPSTRSRTDRRGDPRDRACARGRRHASPSC